ncbi:ABC transporter ATP-binding protein [Aurantimicrobium sp. INA4]|uniref:ABC transporter ATP-binding protein n=1 Tax=Aurantimicrobium sp. INA4 TaxID=2986279 RepID=UPI0024934E51|nr:ABC transporter ATP-binding protein [Aurantimicrobium sp. INA4]BDU11567.1 ABC transporter ATP-binding protein [Aurantimicrobium sp. INA4]
MGTNFIIDARNISKSYGSGANRFDALTDVTFQVQDGESVAIVGKSGSGKSTLMHLIALLDKPDAGTILVEDKDALRMKQRELNKFRNKTFGFVFQQFFLTPNTSVLDNVVLPLKIAGIKRAERKRRGIDILTQFELESKVNNKATALSGGQKQRVVIARALINEPSVIFADEPTGNLDSATGAVVEDILFALNKEKGITLVIVTHDEELAAKCDRQVFLKDGQIVQSLSAPQVKA